MNRELQWFHYKLQLCKPKSPAYTRVKKQIRKFRILLILEKIKQS